MAQKDYISETYTEGSRFNFPQDDINPKNKNAPWHIEVAQSILWAYYNDESGINLTEKSEYSTWRAYGDGKQNIDQYKNRLCPGWNNPTTANEQGPGVSEFDRKGLMNVNWDIFSVAPKIVRKITGHFEPQDHDIIAEAIDPVSIDKKSRYKHALWFERENEEWLRNVREQMGLKQEEQEYLPRTKDELEILTMVGGIKLPLEIAMEMGIKESEELSDWKELKRKMIKDFIDINIAACRDYVDPIDGKVKTRYVDPERLVIQHTSRSNFRNSEYVGEVVDYTIAELREVTDLTEDELQVVAEYHGKYGNNSSYGNNAGYDNEGNLRNYSDKFKVPVLVFEYLSSDDHYRLRRKNNYGEEQVYPEEWGRKVDTEQKRTEIVRVSSLYGGCFIVGTEHIFNWGKQKNIPRDSKRRITHSYHVYQLMGRSIMDMIHLNLDKLQMLNLKMQNSLAKAAPSGLSIDVSSIRNVTFGQKKLNPLQVMAIRTHTGDILYSRNNGRGFSPSQQIPVANLEGGQGRVLEEYIMQVNLELQLINDIIGFGPGFDPSRTSPEQPVGTTKMAIASSNDVLQPLYSGYLNIKESASQNIVSRIQLMVKYSKKSYNGYVRSIGSGATRLFKITENAIAAELGLSLRARATRDDKERLLAFAMESAKNRKDSGRPGISMSDYFLIERLLEMGNVKYAEVILAYKEAESERQFQQNKIEDIKVQAKTLQDGERIKLGNEIAKIKAEETKEINILKAKTDMEMKLKDLEETKKTEREIALKAMEAGDAKQAA